MEVIVGSTALRRWGITKRDPSDFDVWVSTQEEYDVYSQSSGVDVCLIPEHIMDILDLHTMGGHALPNALYSIKLSHMAWDIFWDKHKQEVLTMKLVNGCEIIPDLYETLVEHWKEEHGNKDFLSLYKSKDEFFTDGVVYVYDHDHLHELVAWPNRSVYESVLKDGHQVAIDHEKFLRLPFDQQVRMFREEISVIAAERWLLNPKTCGKIHWTKAYQMALRKTVTALTKNWATEFILMNLEYFHKPDYGYFEYLIKTLPEGEIIMAKEVDIDVIMGEIEEALSAEALSRGISEENSEIDGHMNYLMIDDEGYDFRTEAPDSARWSEKYIYIKPSEIGAEHIHQEGGGEGGSEYCETIFKWKGKIYKMVYSYYSYHGFDVDCASLYEVEPVQKTVTVYE